MTTFGVILIFLFLLVVVFIAENFIEHPKSLRELSEAIRKYQFLLPVIALIAIFAAYLYIILYTPSFLAEKLTTIKSEKGLFGDSFGALNSFFSAFALLGVYFTVRMQRQQIQMQRDEIHNQNLEIGKNKELRRIEQFENSFFNLLNQHNELLNSIGYIGKRYEEDKEKRGKEALEAIFFRFRDYNSSWFEELNNPSIKACLRFTDIAIDGNFKNQWALLKKFSSDINELNRCEINLQWETNYKKTDYKTGYFFRSLFNLIAFVDRFETSNTEFDKAIYTKLIRAQLSMGEILLIFYNCISDLGAEKFKPLVEKYSLLKGIDENLLLHQSHKDLYDKKAYDD